MITKNIYDKRSILFSVIFLLSGILFLILGIMDKSGDFNKFNMNSYNHLANIINPMLTKIAITINIIGEWYSYLAIAIVLCLIPSTRRIYGIQTLGIIILLIGGSGVFKLIFAIPRPNINRLISETGFGFPSGHATYGLGFIGFFIYLYLKNNSEYKHKKLIILLGALYVLMIGVSRVYLGVHNTTDIIGGYLLGVCILSFGILVTERFNYNQTLK